MINVDLVGYLFIWKRSKGKENAVEERLDCAMATLQLMNIYPQCYKRNLVAIIISDHSHILLVLWEKIGRGPKCRFKFENVWLSESNLIQVVTRNWNDNVDGKLA